MGLTCKIIIKKVWNKEKKYDILHTYREILIKV